MTWEAGIGLIVLAAVLYIAYERIVNNRWPWE